MPGSDTTSGPRPRPARAAGRLHQGSWIAAGLRALAQGGVEAVQIDPVRRALGVTRGSFYWHFRSREQFLAQVLEEWRASSTTRVIEWLEKVPDPRERLTRLLVLGFDQPEQGLLYGAVSAASHDPLVRRALEQAVGEQLEFLTRTFAAMGLDPEGARCHALLTHSSYIGLWEAARLERGGVRGADGRRGYIAFLIGRLLPPERPKANTVR